MCNFYYHTVKSRPFKFNKDIPNQNSSESIIATSINIAPES